MKILLVECLIRRIERPRWCTRLDEFSLGQTHPHKRTTPCLGSPLLTWRCDSTQFSRSSDPVPALLSICFRLVFVCTLQLYRYIPCCAPARPLSRHSITAQRGENAPYYPLYTTSQQVAVRCINRHSRDHLWTDGGGPHPLSTLFFVIFSSFF